MVSSAAWAAAGASHDGAVCGHSAAGSSWYTGGAVWAGAGSCVWRSLRRPAQETLPAGRAPHVGLVTSEAGTSLAPASSSFWEISALGSMIMTGWPAFRERETSLAYGSTAAKPRG